MFEIVWYPFYGYQVAENHRLQVEKYELLPRQLVRIGKVSESNLGEPSKGISYIFTI